MSIKTKLSKFKVGMITALPEETAALEYVFGPSRIIVPPYRAAKNLRFRQFSLTVLDREVELISCQTAGMGNNSSAVACTALHFLCENLRHVLMVGIAGGFPVNSNSRDKKVRVHDEEHHVEIGDVVVSTSGVVPYDVVKAMPGSIEQRGMIVPASPELKAAVNELRVSQAADCSSLDQEGFGDAGDEGWQFDSNDPDSRYYPFTVRKGKPVHATVPLHRVSVAPNGSWRPRVHFGRIGSANILLGDPVQRLELARQLGLKAVEMEGSGIAEATWNLGTGYLIVRGISDYCDMNKGDKFKKPASLLAAQLTKLILLRTLF